MNLIRHTRWQTFFAMPLILALIFAGVWLVVAAAYENYHLSRAIDQIIRTVALVRDMHIPPNAPDKQIKQYFIERMHEHNIASVVTTKQAFLEEPAQIGFINPWDMPVSVYFYPKTQIVRLEGLFPSVACRRILFLYAKEAGELGLIRVNVKNEDITSAWRLVYKAKKADKTSIIKANAINVGCGEGAVVALSLSFSL